MADLHSLCFKDIKKAFNEESMLSFLTDEKTHVFYDEISLAIIQVAGSEADLITLAVDPNQHQKGIASNLLHLVLSYLKGLNVKELFLEVAISNVAALKLYNNFGFRTCGVRKNYYSNDNCTTTDAATMVYNLSRKNGKFNKKKLQMLYPTG